MKEFLTDLLFENYHLISEPLILGDVVQLSSMEKSLLTFSDPFSFSHSKNILVCIRIIYWVTRVRILKWVLFTFTCKWVFGLILTNIFEFFVGFVGSTHLPI